MTARISTERILVTNDDGIHASGIKLLEEIARSFSDDVWVVAPESEQSGAAHSLTITEPIRCRRLDARHYAVRGTPTDSVMMAVSHILKDKPPTLLLSGINRGGNLAEDITYSGTVAAAIEGMLTGIPSIALSQVMRRLSEGSNWDAAKRFARDLVDRLLDEPWPADVLINVNFPPLDAEAVKGIRVTEQGRRDLRGLMIEERRDPRGAPYYWFGLSRTRSELAAHTDLQCIHEGWISVTPLHLDLTHAATRRALAPRIEREF
ncbi:MAG: 5'/3'-nucleotidase SurE [Rhodothalassiaceae bacterium]